MTDRAMADRAMTDTAVWGRLSRREGASLAMDTTTAAT